MGRYDRELLERAEGAAARGPMGLCEAKLLYESAEDGPGITDTERATLVHIVDTVALAPAAAKFLRAKLGVKPDGGGASYYRVVGGVRLDRELLEQAEALAE